MERAERSVKKRKKKKSKTKTDHPALDATPTTHTYMTNDFKSRLFLTKSKWDQSLRHTVSFSLSGKRCWKRGVPSPCKMAAASELSLHNFGRGGMLSKG